MKKYIVLIAFLLIAISLNSQIPNTISWQGVLQGNQGNNLNGVYDLTFKLYDVETDGNPLWTEIHQDVNVSNGFTSIILGSVTQLELPFDTQYWLEITIDNGNPMSRMTLTSAPYSFNTKNTSNILDGLPLILKDSQGNDRIILDPDEGTFKMLANDTVWYSVEVNSPHSTLVRHNDGSYTVSSDGGNVKKTYRENGTLLSEETTRMLPNSQSDLFITNFTIYDENGNVVQRISKFQTCFWNGQTQETIENITYVNSPGGSSEYVKEVSQNNNGKLTLRERYQNGNIILREEYDDTKKTTTTRDDGWNFSQQKVEYLKTNKTTVKNGNIGTDLSQSDWAFVFSKYNSNYKLITSLTDDSNTPGYAFQYYNGSSLLSGFTMSKNGQITFSGTPILPTVNVSGTSSFSNNVNISGNLNVTGNVTKGGGNFKIDHPLDPENKFLYHSFVESPDMKNIYDGIITLDKNGEAWVILPDYFEALNSQFRYQLTCIGGFAQVYIAEKIKNNKFKIAGGTPYMEVSWQVTGNRIDPWAVKNKTIVEVEKNENEKGLFLHPDLYGKSKEQGIYK